MSKKPNLTSRHRSSGGQGRVQWRTHWRWRVTAGMVCLAVLVTITGAADKTDDEKHTPPPPPEAPAKLLQWLVDQAGQVESVQASFDQKKKLRIFDRTLELKGRMALKPPGKLVWHVDAPVRYTMLLADQKIRLWDENADTIQEIDLSDDAAARAVFRQFHAWLVGDFAAIAKGYALKLESDDPVWVRFTPREDSPVAEVVRHVMLTLGKDHRYISSLHIVEHKGNQTQVTFDQVKLNKPIPESIWKIPPDED